MGSFLKRLVGLIAVSVLQCAQSEAGDTGVHMHCLSLYMYRSVTDFFGTEYNLFLRAAVDSRSLGEMRPAPFTGHPTTVQGFYRIVSEEQYPTDQEGEISLDLPPFNDANGNGIDDFFETAMALGVVQTSGSFYDPRGGLTKLIATWSRSAGAKVGKVDIQMASRALHLTITFSMPFQIFEYTGSLTYNPGKNAATMYLFEQPRFGNTQNGAISLSSALNGAISFS